MATILLVEDDINLREIYAARLDAEGYILVTASDGEEALSKAVAEKPDLILLDVMMPKISGFDVLDILRSTPETKSTKVVMLSALSQESDRQRGEELGADKYLVKSQITLEDVVRAISDVVNNGDMAASTPIITMSGGRLPDEAPAEPAAGAAPTVNAPTDDTDEAEDNPSSKDKPKATTPETAASRAAAEIADIDSQMKTGDPTDKKAA